jgi:hypothetical protein
VTKPFNPHRDYKVRQQVKRGKKTGKWYVQFYEPAPHYGFWKVGGAQGDFPSKEEAHNWVLALRRLT